MCDGDILVTMEEVGRRFGVSELVGFGLGGSRSRHFCLA